MRKFLERVFGSWISGSSSSNVANSGTSSVSTNAPSAVSGVPTPGTSTTASSLSMTGPTTGMSGAVVPWSPQQQNVNPEDGFFEHHELIALMRRSSSAQTAPSAIQVSGPNLSAFPTSPGLLSYYSHGQHLSYLQHGLVPENVTWALSQITSPNVISSETARQLVRSSLGNSRYPINHRENALESLESRVLLPPSPVKPDYLTHDQFTEISVSVAFMRLLENGVVSPADAILLQNLFRGLPGKNLTNLQYLAARWDPLKAPVDFRNHIPQHLLDILSAEDIERLGSVVLTADVSLVHEMIAMAKINSQQISQLSFTGNIRNPQGSPTPPGYYNNSGNAFPDYVLTLNQPVGECTSIGVDFKFKKHGRGNYDIVKGCSDNFEYHTSNSNQQLERSVRRIVNNPDISKQDRDIGEALVLDIQQNITNYQTNNDVDQYVLASNSIRESYGDFLIRNKIGVNLIAPISVKDIVTKEDSTSQFSAEFNSTYFSEKSPLVKFLQDNKEKYAGKVNPKEIIFDYVLSNFS